MFGETKEYNVEKIVDKKTNNGLVYYKVKWEGYPMSQCTWEPSSHFEKAKEFIINYEASLVSKNKKKNNSSAICLKESVSVCNESLDFTSNKNESQFDHIPKEKKKILNPNTNMDVIKKMTYTKTKSPSVNSVKSEKNSILISVDETITELDILSPLRIVKLSKLSKDNPNLIKYQIEWKENGSGIKPSNSELTSEVIRQKYPIILIDYLESKIQYKK